MIVYTCSEARQKLAELLEKAAEVRIRRRDGSVFLIRPEPRSDSPLDVPSLNLGLTASEILQAIREGRWSV